MYVEHKLYGVLVANKIGGVNNIACELRSMEYSRVTNIYTGFAVRFYEFRIAMERKRKFYYVRQQE